MADDEVVKPFSQVAIGKCTDPVNFYELFLSHTETLSPSGRQDLIAERMLMLTELKGKENEISLITKELESILPHIRGKRKPTEGKVGYLYEKSVDGQPNKHFIPGLDKYVEALINKVFPPKEGSVIRLKDQSELTDSFYKNDKKYWHQKYKETPWAEEGDKQVEMINKCMNKATTTWGNGDLLPDDDYLVALNFLGLVEEDAAPVPKASTPPTLTGIAEM